MRLGVSGVGMFVCALVRSRLRTKFYENSCECVNVNKVDRLKPDTRFPTKLVITTENRASL